MKTFYCGTTRCGRDKIACQWQLSSLHQIRILAQLLHVEGSESDPGVSITLELSNTISTSDGDCQKYRA